MIARAATRPSVASAVSALSMRSTAAPAAAFHASAAPQASLRELESRVKSVKNIEKITKSMNMIASTKLNRAQRAMNSGVLYGNSSEEVFKQSEAKPQEGRQLYIVVSSDKGLCGGIHTSVSKRVRNEVAEAAKKDQSPSVVVLGERSKAQLARAIPKNLVLSFNQLGKDIPTYEDALAITSTILESDIEFDVVNIIYNKFVSSISYESAIMPVFSAKSLQEAPGFGQYEQEDEATKDLAEFSLTNALFATLVEGHATEINAKRNAMDNASTNAGDMITNLNLLYNRGRQAAITGELIEIITGATALSG